MNIINETPFLGAESHLWHKKTTDSIKELFINMLESCNNELETRALTVLSIEFDQAIRTFETSINDLNTIMNCRTMCNANDNFGGDICYTLSKSIRACCEKYLNTIRTENIEPSSSIIETILKIKNISRHDEDMSKEIANKSRALYSKTGQDNSKEIFINSGYTI